MIAKEFERFLLAQEETFLTPAKNLAVLIDTHNVDHAVLLLSQISYSRIPVVTDERKFVGTISLTDILSYQLKHEIPEETFASMDIVDVAKKEVGVIGLDFNLTESFTSWWMTPSYQWWMKKVISKGLLRGNRSSKPSIR